MRQIIIFVGKEKDMLTLLKSCEIYAPDYLGIGDILLGGTKILAIKKEIHPPAGMETELINCSGYMVFPGLIDPVCFFCGNGADEEEQRQNNASDFAEAAFVSGVSSVIGTLGWNDITRSAGELLQKTKQLNFSGLNTGAYTGGFRGNSCIFLQRIASDLAYIQEITATGPMAIADHRAGMPEESLFANLHAEAETGAELGRKSAVVVYMLGEDKSQYSKTLEKMQNIVPVHRHAMLSGVNRNNEAMKAAKKFGIKGLINIVANTTGFFQEETIHPATALKEFLRAGVPIKNITLSSYAGFEAVKPNPIDIKNQMRLFFKAFGESISDFNIPTEIVAKVFSRNAAETFKMQGKGILKPGMHADVLVLTKDYHPAHLFINGEHRLIDGVMVPRANHPS
ncbi:MAG: hypothetical protein PHU97_00765 [Bacteroidales bacterium]|nr:hypothetical protein [Bacteroidales bacterium]MDD3961383.1 hypothetical protein [Bacteroidales bacterium]